MASPVQDQYGSQTHNVANHVANLPSTGLDIWPLVGLAVLFIIIGAAFLLMFFRGVRS